MTPTKSPLPLNDQAREEAADWLVAFCEAEVDAPGRERFMTWLRASPEHVRAYLRLSALWEDDDLFSRNRKLDADACVQRALNETNVIPLDLADMPDTAALASSAPAQLGGALPAESIPEGESFPMRSDRLSRGAPRLLGLSRLPLAIAASMILAVSAALLMWLKVNAHVTYETAIGEQRTITLPDGSTIALNARSKVGVKYDDERRSIELIEGQALFRVAKDTARPFVVRSGVASIRAVGTQFDVYRKAGGTVVTVLEGRVAVSGAAKPNRAPESTPSAQPYDPSSTATPLAQDAFVSAGEQLIATPEALTAPKPADVAAATAWLQGRLVFNAAPLSDVLDEFNRHTRRRLVLDDENLGTVPISGIFAFTDSAQFVEFLRQRFALVVHETDDEIHIARR